MAVGAEHEDVHVYAAVADPGRLVEQVAHTALDLERDGPGGRAHARGLHHGVLEVAFEEPLGRVQAEDIEHGEGEEGHVGDPKRGQAIDLLPRASGGPRGCPWLRRLLRPRGIHHLNR